MLSEQGNSHLLKYWRLSKEFFEDQDYALATFFAITLIEEVGKIVILHNKFQGGEFDNKSFRDHRKKYLYAVATTLLVNSRVSRIYKKEEMRFAKWFREDGLFKIRNNSLYLEYKRNKIITPTEAINKNDALLIVCIAGEALAEIQGLSTGTGPEEWQVLLNDVDKFRQAHLHQQ